MTSLDKVLTLSGIMAKNLFETIQESANHRNRTTLVALIPDEAIGHGYAVKIEKLLRHRTPGPLDLVLHSSGGNVHAAYKIGDVALTNADEQLGIIVPRRAKSAATLLGILGKEIFMGPLAEFGPLDTQISERTKHGGKSDSALNTVKAVEKLTEASSVATDVMIGLLLNKSGITVPEAFRHGIDFGTKMASPLFAQVDPIQLGGYSRALEIGASYAERLLLRTKNLSEETSIPDVVKQLVYGYPSHDFIIDAAELSRLGFPVAKSEEPYRGILEEMADGVLEYCSKMGQTVIELVEPHPQQLPQAPQIVQQPQELQHESDIVG